MKNIINTGIIKYNQINYIKYKTIKLKDDKFLFIENINKNIVLLFLFVYLFNRLIYNKDRFFTYNKLDFLENEKMNFVKKIIKNSVKIYLGFKIFDSEIKIVSIASFSNIKNNIYFSIALDSSYRGKGIAYNFSLFIFQIFYYNTVYIVVDKNNVKAYYLYSKLGFKNDIKYLNIIKMKLER